MGAGLVRVIALGFRLVSGPPPVQTAVSRFVEGPAEPTRNAALSDSQLIW